MLSLKNALRIELPDHGLAEPGLHHFVREVDGRAVRYHVRVEQDGSGLVVANACAIRQLSPSGVLFALGVLGGDEAEARRRARRAFRGAGAERLDDDLRRTRAALDEMADPTRSRPVSSLEDPESSAHRRTLSAPLGADVTVGRLALGERVLERLWEVGVPQAVLGLGADGSGADLVRMVEKAEDLGMVCGVRVCASVLAAPGLLDALALAGLDHLDLFWLGADAASHDRVAGIGDHALAAAAVARCHELELYPTAVVPVTAPVLEDADGLLADLAKRRVGALTAFAVVDPSAEGTGRALSPGAVRQAAATLEELADHLDLNLVWAAPVERDPRVTLATQLLAGPRTAGEASVRVRADGSVVAPTGPEVSAGNLLEDPWERIWGHACFERFRAAVPDPARCAPCPGLGACSGGCPADRASWAWAPGGDS